MTFELETVDDLVAAGNAALARSDWWEARRRFEAALTRAESIAPTRGNARVDAFWREVEARE